jgi:hypothetical protein
MYRRSMCPDSIPFVKKGNRWPQQMSRKIFGLFFSWTHSSATTFFFKRKTGISALPPLIDNTGNQRVSWVWVPARVWSKKKEGGYAENRAGTDRRSRFYRGSLLRNNSARDRWINSSSIDSFSRIFLSVSSSINQPKPSSSKNTISILLSMANTPSCGSRLPVHDCDGKSPLAIRVLR